MNFGQNSNATLSNQLLGYRVSTSLYGTPIPFVMGRQRVAGNCIAVFDWHSVPVSSGGKFGGSGADKAGTGQQQYNYYMGALIALCMGPINGILQLWQDKTRLIAQSIHFTNANSNPASSYTVPPGGGTFNPTNGTNLQTWVKDNGIYKLVSYSETINDYGDPAGSRVITGTQRIPGVLVTGTPGPGQYAVDSSGNYTFAAADSGVVWYIGYVFIPGDPGGPGDLPVGKLAVTIFTGEPGQAVWSGIVGQGTPELGYSEVAYVGNQAWALGTTGQLSNYSWEIDGPMQWGGGVVDCLVTDVINFVLTNRNLANLSSSILGPYTQVANYCLANSIFISPVIDEQQTLADYLREYLQVANAEIVSSEGLLKFCCYSEQTAVGNGAIYVPATQPQYDLDLDDFLADPGEPPIRFSYDAPMDVSNRMSLEWTDRGNEYNLSTLQEEDADSVAKYGPNTVSAITAHSVCLQTVAAQVLNVQLKRACYMLRHVEFTVGWRYARLEPMDVVTIPDQYPSEVRIAVRILTIEEDKKGNLAFKCEMLQYGISAPTLHPKPSPGGYTPGFNANPGPINAPIFFEAPDELTQQVGYELLIGLSGNSPNWGGASVWVSSDGGNTYNFAGRTTSRSNMGILSATLAAGSDPDTTNVASIDLRESLGTAASVTQAVADAFQSLVLIDQELISYEYATATGTSQYNLESGSSQVYLRRGVFGTTITSHAVDAPVLLIDGTQFSYPYESTDVGSTLYFKFTAFNLAGQNEQTLASVSPYKYRLVGPRVPYPPLLTAPPTLGESLNPAGSFTLRQSYALRDNGDRVPEFLIGFAPPANVFSKATSSPVSLSATTASTGGSIPGGVTYNVGLAAVGSDGSPTRMTILSVAVPSGTNTNTISLTFAFANPSTDSGIVYIGTGPEESGLTRVASVSISATTYTIVGPQVSASGAPDPVFDHPYFQATQEFHGGTWAAVITGVTTTGGVTVVSFGINFTANQFNGCVLSLISKADSSLMAWCNPTVTSNDGSGNFTLNANVTASLAVGDVMMMRTKPDTHTSTTIGDSRFVNAAPGAGSGLTVNAETNRLLWILYGTGAGQQRTVASNTPAVFTVSVPFDVTPDSTSVFIVVNPAWPYFLPCPPMLRTTAAAPFYTILPFPVENTASTVFAIQVLCADALGNTSLQQYSPVREIYQPGTQGYKPLSGDTTMQITDGPVKFLNVSAPAAYTCLPFAQVPNQRFTVATENCSADITVQTDPGTPTDSFPNGQTTIVIPAGVDGATTFVVPSS